MPSIYRPPMYQGKLDGLCGFYSVINSFISLDILSDDYACQKLMKKLVIYKKDLFPDVMYTGMVMGHVISLIQKSADILKTNIEIVRPFLYRNKIQNICQFSKKLDMHLSGGKSVAILGLAAPWHHWTVATKINKNAIELYDSIGIKNIKLDYVSVGKPSKYKFKTFICARETIIIKTK